MKDNKHIDRVFQEKLKDLDIAPDPSVWEAIEKDLKKDKKDRRIIPIWWKLGGVAAILLLSLLIGNAFFKANQNTPPSPTIVDTEQQENKEFNTPDETDFKNTTRNPTVVRSGEKETQQPNNRYDSGSPSKDLEQTANASNRRETTTKSSNAPQFKSTKANEATTEGLALSYDTKNPSRETSGKPSSSKVSDKTVLEIKNKVAEHHADKTDTPITKPKEITEATEETIAEETNTEKTPLTEDLVANEETTDEKEKDPINRWQINPNIAPVYFNSLGKGSSIDEQLVNNSKTGAVTMSYGVNVSYALNDKLSIRSGVNKINLGYSTNDVAVYDHTEMSILTSSTNDEFYKNIKLNGAGTNFSIISGDTFSFLQSPSMTNESMTYLSQDLAFYEVPLELKYNISNKKLSVFCIGGFSTLFLSDNKISYKNNGEYVVLGEATNINKTSFSANLGLGIDYDISKTINLNLNPMFKYQLNTFTNTSGNFKPYFIGVYSGLNFTF